MKIVPNTELVLVKADEVEKQSEGGIDIPEVAQQNLRKLQNRGKVVAIGMKVEYWQVGDYVSFYRNGAVPILEEGDEFLSMHQGHILCKFVEL